MQATSLERLLHGERHFLRGDPQELLRVMPDADRVLPRPQRIFLEDELATPLVGFPVLLEESSERFAAALGRYVLAETRLELALRRQQPGDSKARDRAWEEYSTQLVTITENAARSSFGRRYPSILWLDHSLDVARLFTDLPRAIRDEDLQVGRDLGHQLKYAILEKFMDRALAVTFDTVHRVAQEAEDAETLLFPDILTRMRDNVLILSEVHIGPTLEELSDYLRGCVRVDPVDFRARLAAVGDWHAQAWTRDPTLRSAATHLLGHRPGSEPDALLKRPGYMSFLLGRPGYPESRALSARQVMLWESLLVRLKEFELFSALRDQVVRAERTKEGLRASIPTRRDGFVRREVVLSPSTRPIEFATPWIVDPLVSRFGLIYDIADFSAIVSMLRNLSRSEEDRSYRAIFLFQRRINRMADLHRLRLEKYLGDGALYSGRHPTRVLAAAIQLQRAYARARKGSFPFDRGLRVALNYGRYRLLPVEEALEEEGRRYEFFGRGIIELTRLVTGKAIQGIDEMKTLLQTAGYSHTEVERFFEPLARGGLERVEEREEGREFYSAVSASGRLVNEGIVATGAFVEQLDAAIDPEAIRVTSLGSRRYVTLVVDEGSGRVPVGLRRLGVARLKGIGKLDLYEVVDGRLWSAEELAEPPVNGLAAALEKVDDERPREARTVEPPAGGR